MANKSRNGRNVASSAAHVESGRFSRYTQRMRTVPRLARALVVLSFFAIVFSVSLTATSCVRSYGAFG